jgi:nitrogenase-stabilizing/protective protein
MVTSFDPDTDLADLVSAEDFLDYFEIPFDRDIVSVNRLHILQRFHAYLRGAGDAPQYETWRQLLLRAYEDFVHSDARTEAVFSVLRRTQGIATVPLSAIRRGASQ